MKLKYNIVNKIFNKILFNDKRLKEIKMPQDEQSILLEIQKLLAELDIPVQYRNEDINDITKNDISYMLAIINARFEDVKIFDFSLAAIAIGAAVISALIDEMSGLKAITSLFILLISPLLSNVWQSRQVSKYTLLKELLNLYKSGYFNEDRIR